MKTQQSGFSGFLNGYKAQNLESVTGTANVNIKQICALTDSLLNQYPAQKAISLLKGAEALDFSSLSLTKLGAAIKATIASEKLEPTGLLDNNDFRLIVFYFLDTAKISEDNDVIDLALDIGETFKAS